MIKNNLKAKVCLTIAIALNVVCFLFRLTDSPKYVESGTLLAVLAMFGVIMGTLECGALNKVEDFDEMLKVFFIVGVIFVINVVVLPMLLK